MSLALAVAPDPELLILDDPTLGLDTVVRRDFLESLIQIIQREGRTILISSHMLAGASLDRVERELIDPSDLSPDRKAALWLWALSYVGGADQRAQATSYIASLP